MRLFQKCSLFLVMGLPGVCCLIGCSRIEPANAPAAHASAETHDSDDVPITEADVKMPANYAEAVARIRSYRDTVRSAIEGGTPTKAHRSLDELDIVLNKLTAIARDSGVPKDKWEAVNLAARELRDLFDQLHTAIDEKRMPDYGPVAEPIDKAIDRLAKITPSATK